MNPLRTKKTPENTILIPSTHLKPTQVGDNVLKVIILCAGKGSRAREVTGDTPKHLYPVPVIPSLGRILNLVSEITDDIRIVVNPEEKHLFRAYCDARHKDLPVNFYEQTEASGEADAVLCAIPDLRHSQTPLLIVLGDQIPIGELSQTFFGLVASNPSTNVIAVKEIQDPSKCTIVQTKTASLGYVPESTFAHEFVEVRYRVVSGRFLYRAGFYFIKRSDTLFDAILLMKRIEHTLYGEYRLTTAYQNMLNRGAEFGTFPIDYVSVGDKEHIDEAIEYYERRKTSLLH